MKLTSYTNYALRSLQLAALKSPDLVRVDDVAKIHNLSRLQRDNQGENPASIRMRTRVWGHVGRA